MPHRAWRVCPVLGCPELTSGSQRYCTKHRREKQKAEDAARPSPTVRGYDAKWRRIRAEYLQAYSRCMVCGGKATDVHHVLSLRNGGTNDWSNLSPLCHNCHAVISATLDGGYGHAKRCKPRG